MIMGYRIGAIVLAGGKGSRMKSDIHKQYLQLRQRPILYYTLKAFEQSVVDEIVLVCGLGEADYCRKEIVEKYQIKKVTAITEGGRERYNSVYNGLKCMKNIDFVLIHDGARPFLSQDVILKNIEQVIQYQACITAVPSKDTIKIANQDGFVVNTPDRRTIWNVQTPQSFEYQLIMNAYEKLMKANCDGITDDAMVVEQMTKQKIKIIEGEYRNIKITTPDDMDTAQILVQEFVEKYNI